MTLKGYPLLQLEAKGAKGEVGTSAHERSWQNHGQIIRYSHVQISLQRHRFRFSMQSIYGPKLCICFSDTKVMGHKSYFLLAH